MKTCGKHNLAAFVKRLIFATHMVFPIFILFCADFLTSEMLFAGTYTTTMNGNWSVVSVWNPAGCPAASDNVFIRHSIVNFTNTNPSGSIQIDNTGTLSSLDMTVQNGAVLSIYGTLYLNNLTLNNGSTLHVYPSGVLAISGDFYNKNNTINVTVDGNIIVGGNFTNGFGGIINGSGIISVSGVYDGSGSIFGISPTSSIPPNSTIPIALPVKLLSFGAVVSGNDVNISWETASEVNNDYFTIEKSRDGISFYELASIKGKAFSDTVCAYSYCDRFPMVGFNYYRLIQTDFDGKTEVFNICALNIGSLLPEVKAISGLSIGPNPFFNKFVIRLTMQKAITAKIILTNGEGKIFYTRNQQLNEGTNEFFVISDGNLTPGVYYIYVFKDDEELLCQKMLKAQ